MDLGADIEAQAQVNSEENQEDSSVVNERLESRLLEDDVGECKEYIIREKPIGISPSFVIAPKDVYVLSSQTGVIETRIFSLPKPIVRWYKNGHLITSTQFPKIKKHHNIPETYQLEIPQPIASDAGEYTCIARNCYGTITASANLRIIDLETDEHPTFLKRLKRTDIVSEANSHLTVIVSGEPKPKVEWFKNSMPLKESKRIEICHREPRSYVLRFRNALPEDTGVYSCVAHNNSGTTSTSAMVYVETPENLKRVWSRDVALSQLEKCRCPDGWSQREMDNHMYRINLANYHMKYRTPFGPGYTNLF
ncbi:contactin-4-like [Bradysia coprophila]|uniref:contactin-4-like n=1 Tax=Bradysia coprophila TaxID=38358 RepID=UPI00187D87F0|nr:contactin-4-like [Bradysia coprophila]